MGDRNAWARAERMNTRGGYETYLQTYPRGAYAAEAQRRIAEIDAQDPARREDVVWQAALRANTQAGYLAYLAEFPNGRYKAEAFIRLLAAQRGTPGP